MNIIEIDCVSFATRVAFAASGELFVLLTKPEAGTGNRLYLPLVHPEADVQAMGAYVCNKGCESAEQLFNHLRDSGRLDIQLWQDVDETTRLALGLFVDTCTHVYTKLHGLQGKAEAAERTAAVESVPLKLEDSIFEPYGSMAERDPARVEALRGIAVVAAEQQRELQALAARELQEAGDRITKSIGQVFAQLVPQDAAETLPSAPKAKPARRKPARPNTQRRSPARGSKKLG